MEEESIVQVPKIKINPKKMPLLLCIAVIIFCATLYIFLHPPSIVQTFLYNDNCTEVYINGVLNGTECPLHNVTNKLDTSGFNFSLSNVRS